MDTATAEHPAAGPPLLPARHPRIPVCVTGLVDQYGRGVLHGELGLGAFEGHLAAAAGALGGTPPRGSSFFDSGLGRDVRRWCPPLLGLEPHCAPARYLARRRELGAYAAARALLRGSGIEGFLVDVSGRPRGLDAETTTPAELAAAAQGRAGEAVSLAALAAQVADTSSSAGAFLANVAEAVHGAARSAAAFVSSAGFHEAAAPGPAEVRRAADRWLRARTAAPAARAHVPEEPALVRHLLWAAVATGRPVQLHCADPERLTGFLAASTGLGARVVLVPRPPYHRAAARLAAAFPHVYADVGPVPARTLAEAPSGKLLFSTGARALPELYVVAARRFTAALERLLAGWAADGGIGRADAARVAAQLTGGNARRLYRLEAASA